jgi:hypothetical protein
MIINSREVDSRAIQAQMIAMLRDDFETKGDLGEAFDVLATAVALFLAGTNERSEIVLGALMMKFGQKVRDQFDRIRIDGVEKTRERFHLAIEDSPVMHRQPDA